MSISNDLAAPAAEFTAWHIWRGRSQSERQTDWLATCKPDGTRRSRVAAAGAGMLRELLAQHEALQGAAA